MDSPESDATDRVSTSGDELRFIACRATQGEESFQFTIWAVEKGYRLSVNHGLAEYGWPNIYPTLEKAGQEILRALTTASECRGEIKKRVSK